MSADPYSTELETIMSERAPARWAEWRERLYRLRARARGGLLFVAGVLAAFRAIVLYQALFPPPRPLTTNDVNTSIAAAIASVTPQPAFSERVYQVIQPSLVLIQADSPGSDGAVEHGLGSGVIINDQGDIL